LFTNSHPFFCHDYQPELTEKNKLAKTMDLLDVSVKPNELAIIRNKRSRKQLIHDTFNAIVNSSLSKLSKWEGTTDINKKKSHQKSTYISLGARVVHVLTKHLAKTCKELDGKLT
jgi:DNA-binding transcriptional regulator YiaG